MQILKEDCPKEEGNDRSLPYTAYVIEYKDKDGGLHYDISISDSTVDIFDHYYDKFKKDFEDYSNQKGGRIQNYGTIQQTNRKKNPEREEEDKVDYEQPHI